MFYKIKALHELGIKIHLHCFEYGRGQQPELNKYCEEVFYYQREIIVSPYPGIPNIFFNLSLKRFSETRFVILSCNWRTGNLHIFLANNSFLLQLILYSYTGIINRTHFAFKAGFAPGAEFLFVFTHIIRECRNSARLISY